MLQRLPWHKLSTTSLCFPLPAEQRLTMLGITLDCTRAERQNNVRLSCLKESSQPWVVLGSPHVYFPHLNLLKCLEVQWNKASELSDGNDVMHALPYLALDKLIERLVVPIPQIQVRQLKASKFAFPALLWNPIKCLRACRMGRSTESMLTYQSQTICLSASLAKHFPYSWTLHIDQFDHDCRNQHLDSAVLSTVFLFLHFQICLMPRGSKIHCYLATCEQLCAPSTVSAS